MEHAQYNFKSQEVLDFRGTLEKYMWFFAVFFCSGFVAFSFFFRFRLLVNLAVDLKCVWSLRETVTDNFTSTGDCSMAER